MSSIHASHLNSNPFLSVFQNGNLIFQDWRSESGLSGLHGQSVRMERDLESVLVSPEDQLFVLSVMEMLLR